MLVIVGRAIVLITLLALAKGQQDCSRVPSLYGRSSPKSPGSNGYQIIISGNHTKYRPNQRYTVKLEGYHTATFRQNFEGFYLTVEAVAPVEYGLGQRVGRFQLFDGSLTRFSDRCPNLVTHTSSVPKTEVTVMWTAPPAGSGCLVFRATVVEHQDVWYKDEGTLSRQMCEQVEENMDEQPPALQTCCACDEAKYEVTFEGLWSRHTHPNDFPRDQWDTAFSDIIGASHGSDYHFWEYGELASEGVRQVAEWGDTKKLESELKRHSRDIRTIIKARGLQYPNLQSSTFAVFRTDREHHQASLIARIKPSPDWLVGVSAMELCLRNCSWAERQVLNLRPWDAGTSNGVSYLSSTSPTMPQQKVQRITSKWPANSPFYDPSGLEMPPLARLTIQRQRVYQRFCGDSGPGEMAGLTRATLLSDSPGMATSSRDVEDSRRGCETGSWGAWSACSVSCGEGFKTRMRQYRNPMSARILACASQLQQQASCRAPSVCPTSLGYGSTSFGSPWFSGFSAPESEDCSMTEWSNWTPCSVTCGRGTRSRNRSYRSRLGRKRCSEPTKEEQVCMGQELQCLAPEHVKPGCQVTFWSDWSPCSVTCGEEGQQIRTRMYLSAEADPGYCDLPLTETTVCRPNRLDCSLAREEAQAICTLPQDQGSCRSNFERWYYNSQQGMCVRFIYGGCKGNRNNFHSHEECSEVCEQTMSGGDSSLLGNEFGTRYTAPLSYDSAGGSNHVGSNSNGGIYGLYDAVSDSPLTSGSRVYGDYAPEYERDSPLYSSSQYYNPLVASHSRMTSCETTSWSAWGPCSATCGSGTQQKHRSALPGAICSARKLVKQRECLWLPRC